ncbi:uncharacterized protein LOC108650066 [Drosophila navojoa]|uniref:uncharacterized protein LOC108650066 n=1 Tax=Drosophila navojoa TaxID=7232 RepID=UPI0011BF0807|nr:uncharacterized protein LOC108650066 [Drosophila navojoa]
MFPRSVLHFGLRGRPAERVERLNRQFSSYLIPKLKTSEPIRRRKSRIAEKDSHDMDASSEDPLATSKSAEPNLPTTEELWHRFEAYDNSQTAEWPACCLIGTSRKDIFPYMSSPLPPPLFSPVFQLSPKPKRECDTLLTLAQKADIDAAIASIDNDKFPHRDEWEKNMEMQQQQDVNHIQFDSISLGLEEERSLTDFLKSKRLYAPLSDVHDYQVMLSMVGDEDQREKLRDMLMPKLLKQRKANPPIVVNNEDLQKAIDSIIIVEPPAEQLQQVNINDLIILENQPIIETTTTDQPVIVSVNGLLPEDVVVQEWLQKVGHDLSLVVQTRIESMPASEQPKAEAIDYEAKISECSQLQPSCKINPIVPKINVGPWQNSFQRRLQDFDELVDQSMSEFRDPQSKRPVKRSLESLKRVLQLPALPSHLDQRLQQLRILRQPIKRKAEPMDMLVEMKMVRLYSTLQANRRIDVTQLAQELDNAIFNSDVQVLQQNFEGGHMAWIWQNGNILIINARSKAVLLDTQRALLAKILGSAQSFQLAHCNAVHSQMVHIAQLTWQISIDDFSQSYSLGAEPTHDGIKYVHYVNKMVPGVVAKVYENGAIQVYAMNTSLADTMLEKLYLLTANHRKPRVITVPMKPMKPIVDGSGTFVSLYPT